MDQSVKELDVSSGIGEEWQGSTASNELGCDGKLENLEFGETIGCCNELERISAIEDDMIRQEELTDYINDRQKPLREHQSKIVEEDEGENWDDGTAGFTYNPSVKLAKFIRDGYIQKNKIIKDAAIPFDPAVDDWETWTGNYIEWETCEVDEDEEFVYTAADAGIRLFNPIVEEASNDDRFMDATAEYEEDPLRGQA